MAEAMSKEQVDALKECADDCYRPGLDWDYEACPVGIAFARGCVHDEDYVRDRLMATIDMFADWAEKKHGLYELRRAGS